MTHQSRCDIQPTILGREYIVVNYQYSLILQVGVSYSPAALAHQMPMTVVMLFQGHFATLRLHLVSCFSADRVGCQLAANWIEQNLT